MGAEMFGIKLPPGAGKLLGNLGGGGTVKPKEENKTTTGFVKK